MRFRPISRRPEPAKSDAARRDALRDLAKATCPSEWITCLGAVLGERQWGPTTLLRWRDRSAIQLWIGRLEEPSRTRRSGPTDASRVGNRREIIAISLRDPNRIRDATPMVRWYNPKSTRVHVLVRMRDYMGAENLRHSPQASLGDCRTAEIPRSN